MHRGPFFVQIWINGKTKGFQEDAAAFQPEEEKRRR
jgi:hypothetical protein